MYRAESRGILVPGQLRTWPMVDDHVRLRKVVGGRQSMEAPGRRKRKGQNMKTRLFVLSVLGAAANVHGGAVLELVPDSLGPYYPEQSVTVEVLLHNGDAVEHDLRLIMLDIWSVAPRLVAGGDFTSGGSANVNYVAKLGADTWASVGAGTDGPVYSLAPCFGDRRPDLCVGGIFEAAGGESAAKIAQWNGYTWSEIGGGREKRAHVLLARDEGSEKFLYVSGLFDDIGGVPTRVAKWDGQQWATFRRLDLRVETMAFFDDGTGSALYAGGV